MAKTMKRGTRKSHLNNKRRKGFGAVLIPWLKRFGIVVACLTGVIWLAAWFFLSDADTRTADWVHEKTLQQTAALGFEVDNILVEGRRHTDSDILMALINMQKGDPLFAFDPAEAKAQIEKITWVETAHVERRWPDTLYIKLFERQPLALWQHNKRLQLLDGRGDIIQAGDLKPFQTLVMVNGENAPLHTPELMGFLAAEPLVSERADRAVWMSNRRWDITLKNGITLKMPEDDFGLALRRLVKAHDENKILDQDLKAIDLRKSDRMIIQTKPGKAQDYQEYKARFLSGEGQAGNNI